jgi:hypothetical protein
LTERQVKDRLDLVKDKENEMTNNTNTTTAVALVRELSGQDACHAVGCSDLQKVRKVSDIYEEHRNIAEAEADYNESLSEEAGYDEPWIWSRDVKVYPCATK